MYVSILSLAAAEFIAVQLAVVKPCKPQKS